MQKSYANLLLSVRRITQTNTGKLTAGIDREIVKTPEERVTLSRPKSSAIAKKWWYMIPFLRNVQKVIVRFK